jgi:hypothetical protein
VFAGTEAAHDAVVDATEQLVCLIGDTDGRELGKAVAVADDTGVFELTGFVENDDGAGSFVLFEPID